MSDYFSATEMKKQERVISSLLGKDILEDESMRRLRGVSFLGILNIAAGVPESLRFSRYDHSISVAYLTWNYCQNLKLPEDISLTATLLALIHDISHPPFSHSSEIYLQIRSGVQTQHTSALTESKIAKFLIQSYKSFHSLPGPLQKEGLNGLIIRLKNLLIREERIKYHPYLTDILDAPFCPDTFDGINRAWYALNREEVKLQLGSRDVTFFEALDPIALNRFISTTTDRPFVYKSATPPSESNLIFKFHTLMKTLYNDIIYSNWQSSAMVMFTRALEIAYAKIRRFNFSQKNDVAVISKIRKDPISAKLYNQIIGGEKFLALSEQNSKLHKITLDIYEEKKNLHKSDLEIKNVIEEKVARKLGLDTRFVFCHIYKPLRWSFENIWFKEIQNQPERLWLLKWDPSEGEQDVKSKIEVYYTRSFV